jgi:hypothetical protein
VKLLVEMNSMDPNRNLLLIAFTAALFGFAASARADVAPAGTVRADAGISGLAQLIQADGRSIVQAQISDAMRDLEQACLQRDFASNARELALLQWAREDLVAAARQLHGVEHARAIDLLADLDHAIRRASTHLGPLLSPDGDMYGPQPPSRDQLAQLATEAQDLERNAPKIHRLRDTVSPESTPRDRTEAQSANRSATAALGEDPLSWPLGPQAAWPQAQVPF